jgi:TatA/E family protein of Tat protein translocase
MSGYGSFLGPDTLIIFLIILVLFGAKRLPELGRGLGEALREFRKAHDDMAGEPDLPWEWVDRSLVAAMLLIVLLCVLSAALL